MKDMIAAAERGRKNEGQLAMENLLDKTAMAEVAKVSSVIDLGSKYSWAISDADIDVARDLGLTGIKKYWRCAGQIQAEVDWLHKDWIPALGAFVKHSRRTHDNKEVTKNMSIRREVDPEWASSLFVRLHESIHCWKMDGKDIADATKLVKELMRCSLGWGTDKRPRQDHVWIGGGEPEDGPLNDRKPWNGKQIGKLLLTVTVADPERFTAKDKPITYTGAFVELYNWRNRGQVHEIHGIVELERWRASTAEHPRNLGAYRIVEISSILRSAHVVPRDQEKNVFYVNNYIDWDQFNQLYAPDWLEKGVRNADAVARRLEPASTKAADLRKEEARKKQEVVDRRKAETLAEKRRKRGI